MSTKALSEELVANSGVASGSVGLSDRLKAIEAASSSLRDGTSNANPSLLADTQRRSGPGGTTTVECHWTQDGNTEVNTTLESNRLNPLSRMRGPYVIRTEGTSGQVDVSGGINLNPLGTTTTRNRTILNGRVDGVQVSGGAGNVVNGVNPIKPTGCSPGL
jgi:hypothetical protein